jgi:hypothetical protein
MPAAALLAGEVDGVFDVHALGRAAVDLVGGWS